MPLLIIIMLSLLLQVILNNSISAAIVLGCMFISLSIESRYRDEV